MALVGVVLSNGVVLLVEVALVGVVLSNGVVLLVEVALVGVVLSNGVVLLLKWPCLVGVVLDGWSGPTLYQELSILAVIT